MCGLKWGWETGLRKLRKLSREKAGEAERKSDPVEPSTWPTSP